MLRVNYNITLFVSKINQKVHRFIAFKIRILSLLTFGNSSTQTADLVNINIQVLGQNYKSSAFVYCVGK